MKTLKSQIILVSTILLCVLAILSWLFISAKLEEKKVTEEYSIKNKIAGYLNAAAGWQAIERGFGAAIIGSGKGSSSGLYLKFLDMGKKGDAEVSQVEEQVDKLVVTGKAFIDSLNKWRTGFETLRKARSLIAAGRVSKKEWLTDATANINNEFNLRNITFAPRNNREQVTYLNTVLRPNVATLAEFAGLERALVANAIAEGKLLSVETMNKIKDYRSIVEQSLVHILLLKGLPSTSKEMEQAIEKFESEFLKSYQMIREKVFTASKKQVNAVNAVFELIATKQRIVNDYFAGIGAELINIRDNKSVTALTKALTAGNNAKLDEQMDEVENLFAAFSQVKRVYSKIRFLDNFGHERVRVDFDGKSIRKIGKEQLQDESGMDYFRLSTNLLSGKIYHSPLELNTEKGKITLPFEPTIRYATPVYIDGKKGGIIVFTLMANNSLLLHIGEENSEVLEKYIIVTGEGFYIHHPDEAKEWGMMDQLNRQRHNIKSDYPEAADGILSGGKGVAGLSAVETFIYRPVFFDGKGNTGNFWVIIKRVGTVKYPVDAAAWIEAATKAINTVLAISNVAGKQADDFMQRQKIIVNKNIFAALFYLSFVLLLFFLFIQWSKNRILNPIRKLEDITQKITEGDLSQRIEVKSEDEIGHLSLSFNRMTEDLQVSLRDLENIMDSMTDSLIVVSPDGIIQTVNKATCNLLGYTEDELLNQPIRKFFIEEPFVTTHDGVIHSVISNIEKTFISKQSRRIPVLFSGSFIRVPLDKEYLTGRDDGGNKGQGVVCSAKDITRQKQAEALLLKAKDETEDKAKELEKSHKQLKDTTVQLIQSAKLSSLGEMTAGIAHEMNQPLNNINLTAQSMLMDLERNAFSEQEIKADVQDIIDEIKRMSTIIDHMRTFTRKSDDTYREKIDINGVIEGVFKLIGQQLKVHNFEVKKDLDPNLPDIMADQGKLGQVFTNLIVNARDAIEDFRETERKIEIKSYQTRLSRSQIGLPPSQETQKFSAMKKPEMTLNQLDQKEESQRPEIIVEVKDNGGGISDESKEKILEPFFTTKAPGKGTGLGLSIVDRLVKEHQGRIEVESKVGEGSLFRVVLPVQDK